MGVHVLGTAGDAAPLGAQGVFAGWPGWLARAALAALALLLVASMLVPVGRDEGMRGANPLNAGPTASERTRMAITGEAADQDDEDIALYKAAIRRIRAGENYYDFIADEHRARNYPVNPGLAVRLPTLAYLDAWLGPAGQIVAALCLMLGVIAAWWRKFGEDAQLRRLRRVATAMVFVGASLGLNRYYFVLHELWAGMLLALSFGLHRIGRNGQGGKWLAAWLAAALALAIREHSLPFVLLMGAVALWHRNWKEAAAWGLLVALFIGGMVWHLSIVAAHVLPGDPRGPDWLVFRGLSGWLGNFVQSSNLRWLPHWLAGPAVVLMTFGWLGWRSHAGVAAFLLGSGYGVAFMLAGRWDNFYWGAMIAPVIFAGIVFAPRALADLAAAARIGGNARREPRGLAQSHCA